MHERKIIVLLFNYCDMDVLPQIIKIKSFLLRNFLKKIRIKTSHYLVEYNFLENPGRHSVNIFVLWYTLNILVSGVFFVVVLFVLFFYTSSEGPGGKFSGFSGPYHLFCLFTCFFVAIQFCPSMRTAIDNMQINGLYSRHTVFVQTSGALNLACGLTVYQLLNCILRGGKSLHLLL